MKERPIIFSAPMVRAILEGRKTQTRRPIMQPLEIGEDDTGKPWPVYPSYVNCGYNEGELADSPYGVTNDRLWIRETLQTGSKNNPIPALNHCWRYVANNEPVIVDPRDETAMRVWVHHKEREVCVPIHMPRWASRITLEITDVRVQRVQEIREEDAREEGAEFHDGGGIGHSGWRHDRNHGFVYSNARASFAELWDSINAKNHPWASNPWVWCLSFRRVQ